MICIGIDPGLSGAIVVLSGTEYVSAHDMPVARVGTKKEIDSYALCSIITEICAGRANVRACVEKVHAMPRDSSSGAFKFGDTFGQIKMLLIARGVSHEFVTPQRWKKDMLHGSQKDKDASRVVAMQLFPTASEDLKLKKHHGRADALLIAEWLRRRAQPPIRRKRLRKNTR